jgi:hypothetical protein
MDALSCFSNPNYLRCTFAVQIHAHYFEDGNVQLQTSRPVKAVSVSKGAGLADSVCETIKVRN